ncbi:AarF/ABC1/UbiB kinase family protein [Alicyclobacillus fastidiosus]|uniref:AarF/ABC1/UbiB kinase family protein n=1 Tax=Alicyclobacillus fastidiosus TaxID=392011 RepID=A0ABY6ZJ54_9BACL|nr:AarF/ABC1/UbiB kinase family protein [Alicyclobacillus fastidiosus]WAH42618.1 AarF/ABC1/UbiB kinase family protein [Alicyclobacillus fastidiosus]GMA64490.1 ABC transporter [Alicyclobacillus fastidiosus]
MVGPQILGKRVRHLSRYKDIARILVANGFGWFIDEIGLGDVINLPRRLFSERRERPSLTTYERIRHVIEQLGPTFIKLGQVASLRADVFPAALIEQLARLQDEVPPFSFDEVQRIVENELGEPLAELFSEFDEEPVGSASIGQVHRARLRTGEEVAVKIQRPDIGRIIEIDLEILMDLARLAERNLEWAEHYELTDVVEEFRYTLLNELNYTIEGRNADRLRKIHQGDKTVKVPEIYWDWTTSRVLTMEYVRGIKLANRTLLEDAGYDTALIAERAAHAVFDQLLIHGFFHADPHPGNLAVLPDHSILFMDFGMVGRLTSEMKRYLAGLIVGLMRRDSDAIVRVLYRMGVVPQDIDDAKLHRDVDGLREKYYDVPFQQISLGEATGDLFAIAYKHRIKIPADLTLVGKTLITIEGVVEGLNPAFRILNIAEPFGRKLLMDRLNPKNLSHLTMKSALDLFDLFTDFPKQFRAILRGLSKGRVKVAVEVPEADRLVSQFIRIGNRLSFSIVLLSFSIFMAGLMVASVLSKTPSALWSLPMTDIGALVGVVLFVVLVISIWRSNR